MGILGAWLISILADWGKPSPSAANYGEDDGSAQSARGAQLMLAVINIAIVIAFSFTPFIDWAAHGGGLIGGCLLAIWYFAPNSYAIVGATPAPPAPVRPAGVVSTRTGAAGTATVMIPAPGTYRLRDPTQPAASPARRKAMMLSYGALALYLLLVILSFALLYGGVVEVNPVLLHMCEVEAAEYPQYGLKCPW